MAVIAISQKPIKSDEPIRIITTGAMQSRFTLDEEVAVLDGTDTKAKVIRDRLFNSKNINLDLQELIDGVTYLVTYLNVLGIITNVEDRMSELLADGTVDEMYIS